MCLRQFVLAGLLLQLYASDPFKQAEMFREEQWEVAAYHLLGFADINYAHLNMIQFRRRAEL